MSQKIDLLLIDPQRSFCEPTGALFVPGAVEDMERLTTMVNRISSKLNDIHVTLDSHHYVDVAHSIFWKDSSGKHPDPFTIISAKDVENGTWTTSIPSMYKRMLSYVQTLETNGRYPLCIWPPHCLIGDSGHAVVPNLFEALQSWEKDNIALVDYVTKGSNIYTEHYSAICADVPDPEDVGTQINTKLIETLMTADVIVVAGEAGSHCLNFSIRDIATAFEDDSYVKKIVLLTDAISPVPGFEAEQEKFIEDMTTRGMKLSTTTEFLS